MLSFSLYLFLLLPMFKITSAELLPYTPTDNILLNCGAISQPSAFHGREWDTDTPYISNISATNSTQSEPTPSVDQIPYSTARIFPSKFTYTFNVSEAGQKFLRLYFYPTNYSNGFDSATSFFSVHAADHILLSNFSAFLNLQPGSLTLVKEYVITVDQSRLLELTFTPSPKSYAFVNAIEVVSIPKMFYIKGNGDIKNAIKMVGRDSNSFYIDDSMALENLYRLNVGGNDISSASDSGMFRSWNKDEPNLLGADTGLIPTLKIPIRYTNTTPPYTAPEDVYSTARTMENYKYISNMTWFFQVDSGFYYLLRLYFCEIRTQVNNSGQVAFDILINNQTAQQEANIFGWTGGIGVPIYKDYATFVSPNPDGSKSKPYLWLALQSKSTYQYRNTILNGLEIFRVSSASLAAPNPEFVPSPPLETNKSSGNQKNGVSHSLLVGACIGGSLGGMILFLLIIGFLLFRRRKAKSQDVGAKSMWNSLRYDKSKSTNTNISSLPSVRSRKFSLEEIKLATSNFDDNFVIGAGGFGNVYKGYLENGTCTVAIKRLNQSSGQGELEFQTEIKMLSNLRHLHLVPLIGYCDDGDEMILVYEYMVNGTLRSHLYRGDNPSLSWKQRLQICIGAARGLHYLHEGAERMIIHRDVKSTNILLDEKMVAKVSDFGLSKLGPSDTSVTHVSTIVKGTFGYLDPEYYRRHQLTIKSDVFSFGVVLFEVLCARPVIMQQVPKEQVNLAEWARNCYKKGSLAEIVDKNLMGEIAVESLNKFGEIGCSCLSNHGIDRPSMSDVVWSLEFALQLQETYEKLDQQMHLSSDDPTVSPLTGAKDDSAKNYDDLAKNYDDLFTATTVAKASETSATTSDSDGMKSGSVFSEILNPNAR
ncbi:receptor-like protein kinase FERONIA [Apium graveolens]|uniref:receptor-like protein kinase FERONIA n=1 Tax=Apium graveolens TaxID=4045 RepID=UPI003D7A125C